MAQHTQTNQYDTPHQQKKSKNHMIISADAEKHLMKFNIHSGLKTLTKVITEAIYDKLAADILKGEKVETFPLIYLELGTRMPIFTTSIEHSTGSPNTATRKEKRNEKYPNWKGRGKTVLICR